MAGLQSKLWFLFSASRNLITSMHVTNGARAAESR